MILYHMQNFPLLCLNSLRCSRPTYRIQCGGLKCLCAGYMPQKLETFILNSTTEMLRSPILSNFEGIEQYYDFSVVTLQSNKIQKVTRQQTAKTCHNHGQLPKDVLFCNKRLSSLGCGFLEMFAWWGHEFAPTMQMSLKSGMSKLVGCQGKSPPIWLVLAGYSAWNFSTDGVF